MTTNELIRQAMVCASNPTICVDCPYFDEADDCFNKLLVELADRLEMAYEDLENFRCESCDVNFCGGTLCKWQWRGDVE